jgi:hypothetical protein
MYHHGVRRQSEAATALWLVYADAPYLMRCRPSIATDPTDNYEWVCGTVKHPNDICPSMAP